MRTRMMAFALAAVTLAGCGRHESAAKALQACVEKRLPGGSVTHVIASTVEGVTSLTYSQRGGQTDLTIFNSVSGALAAAKAEARIGDAHDRRVGNVLYTGGIGVRDAVAACLRP